MTEGERLRICCASSLVIVIILVVISFTVIIYGVVIIVLVITIAVVTVIFFELYLPSALLPDLDVVWIYSYLFALCPPLQLIAPSSDVPFVRS